MRLRSMRADAVVSVKERPAGPALAHTAQAGTGIEHRLHKVLRALMSALLVANGILLELARTSHPKLLFVFATRALTAFMRTRAR